MASRQNSSQRQQSTACVDNFSAKRMNADTSLRNMYCLDNGNDAQQIQHFKHDIKSFSANKPIVSNNQAAFMKNAVFNTQALNGNRTFRDSVDSDIMSNHTISSEDSSANADSKETYSSHPNNTALNSLLHEKEEAITSLLCSIPYLTGLPHINIDSSQKYQFNQQPRLSIDMSSDEIVTRCRNVPIDTKIVQSIVSDVGEPPRPPDPPYPHVPRDKLNPPTPNICVSSFQQNLLY